MLRVRATRGVRITNFYGNSLLRGTDLLALPNCTADSSFAVDVAYDEVRCPYTLPSTRSPHPLTSLLILLHLLLLLFLPCLLFCLPYPTLLSRVILDVITTLLDVISTLL